MSLDTEEINSSDAGEWSAPTLRPRTRGTRRTRRRLFLVAIVLAAAAGFLLYKAVSSAVVYFKTADEALQDRSGLGNSTFQIEGVVVPGTIKESDGSSIVRFSISSGPAKVRVVNTGSPPQLFQKDVPVVLVGHFVGSSDLFASDQILVKHSNQYIAAHPNRVRAPNGSVH